MDIRPSEKRFQTAFCKCVPIAAETDFSSDLVFAHFALAAAVLTKVLHVDFLLLKNYAVPLDKDLVDKIGKAKQIAL